MEKAATAANTVNTALKAIEDTELLLGAAAAGVSPRLPFTKDAGAGATAEVDGLGVVMPMMGALAEEAGAGAVPLARAVRLQGTNTVSIMCTMPWQTGMSALTTVAVVVFPLFTTTLVPLRRTDSLPGHLGTSKVVRAEVIAGVKDGVVIAVDGTTEPGMM